MSQNRSGEKEITEVEKFHQKSAYQMTYRHALYTARKLKEVSTSEQKKAEAQKFAFEENFLFRFSHDYFFYRAVRKKEMRKKWYWNQIREIGYLILLDLLHPENAFPTKAEKKTGKLASRFDNLSSDWLGDRQLRRIRKNYREVFFTPRNSRQNKKDQRLTRYSTIFNHMPLENDEEWPIALQLLAAQDLVRSSLIEVIGKARETVAGLRMVDPDDIVGLEKFWEMEKRSLEIITANFHQSTDHKWLIPMIRKRANIVEVMYQFIDKAVALRWFRMTKSDEKRERLLGEKHPLQYSKEDAKRAVELTFRWFEDQAKATDIAFRGANAYGYLGKFKIERSLYEECLKQPLELIDRGLCCHNIAFTYGEEKKPRKYLGWLKKALATFEEAGSQFDTGITWAYIAEAYYMLGKLQKFKSAKNTSERILSGSNLIDLQLSQAYLFVADCAMRIRDRVWEKEAVILGLHAASKLDDLYAATYLSQRLGDLDAGKWTFEAEQEDGKLKRPPIFRWHRDSVSFTAITASAR
jgi:tetratricopeptide (TPR) repeat protein